MHYFRRFFNKISKPCLKFSRIWTKNTILCETFEIFQKFRKKISKMNYFGQVSTNFKTPLIFRSFGRKMQIIGKCWDFWLKFNRKIEFLTSFGEIFTKNRAFEMTSFLYNNISLSGGRSLCSPGRGLWLYRWQLKNTNIFMEKII